MKISSIQLYRVQIPFKKVFKHASRERQSTDNIVVATELENGIRGYGEALPREYVTGEDQEGVIAALGKLNSQIFAVDFEDIEAVIAFLGDEILSKKNFPHDKENNSARCAIELSLLDAYCQQFKKSFSDVATIILKGSDEIRRVSPVYYDGVLSMGSLTKSLWSTLKLRYFGFRRLKIKVGADFDSILRTIQLVRKIAGKKVDLRIDANEALTLDEALALIRALEPLSVTSVEQPISHSKLMEMRELKRNSSIPLMLDESLCTVADAQKAIDNGLCDLFNVRISKCGGFINSLKIAKLARDNGLGYQLGCLVGETGILSAAGRQYATMDPSIRYLEGSYDRYLLRDNIIREEISFGRGGEAHAIEGYGLGVHVNPTKLSQYSVYRKKLIA